MSAFIDANGSVGKLRSHYRLDLRRSDFACNVVN